MTELFSLLPLLEKQWLSSAKKQSQESYKTMPCFIIMTGGLTLCLQLQMCHFGFDITQKKNKNKTHFIEAIL